MEKRIITLEVKVEELENDRREYKKIFHNITKVLDILMTRNKQDAEFSRLLSQMGEAVNNASAKVDNLDKSLRGY